jgi:hypothetical protein
MDSWFSRKLAAEFTLKSAVSERIIGPFTFGSMKLDWKWDRKSLVVQILACFSDRTNTARAEPLSGDEPQGG